MNAFRTAALVLAASAGLAGAAFAPAGAQMRVDARVQVGPHGTPQYREWQSGWDRGNVDSRHVMIGRVVRFTPFRLEVATRNAGVQTIDLKNGTAILPTGTTPRRNERVAVVGYYSNGTFIANRVLVRG